MKAMIAAGRAIRKFILNLSFISTPWVFVAAIVVSEITERLSPNIAPPITAAITSGRERPALSAVATAIGPTALIVPTDVPVATAINADIINIPPVMYLAGITDNPRFTVASTPPIAFATEANAPANK